MNVILIGASTRAAAQSALRAGWSPWCADLFADADLERIATAHEIPADEYPDGLLSAIAHAPPGPVIYTGSLENRPDLIARIERPIWGNPPAILRAIRNPERWTPFLQNLGISCPLVCDRPQANGSWLLKPRKSGGGLGIQRYVHQAFDLRTHYLQEHIEGTSCSAIYVGMDRQTIFLGVTHQLVGIPWLNATGYQYCGNIAPLPLPADQESRWRKIGDALGQFPLRGLFGVDAIVRDGVPWPVEINPRYTASVELFERSSGQALLPLHANALGMETVGGPLPRTPDARRRTIHGKAILYARKTFAFPAGPWLDESDYADVPHAGEVIEEGRPVLTIFASATSVSDCVERLKEKARDLDQRLWG
jgi:predicted ATP-grasp superfamily ATP-dependent carboligase